MSHLHQALKGPALNRDKDGTTLHSLWENLLKTKNREGDRGPLFEIKKGWDQKRNHKVILTVANHSLKTYFTVQS